MRNQCSSICKSALRVLQFLNAFLSELANIFDLFVENINALGYALHLMHTMLATRHAPDAQQTAVASEAYYC